MCDVTQQMMASALARTAQTKLPSRQLLILQEFCNFGHPGQSMTLQICSIVASGKDSTVLLSQQKNLTAKKI